MFLSIDRFVLSQVEKAYQFLQRHFGLKLSTAIEASMLIFTLCFWITWYFHKDMPTANSYSRNTIAFFASVSTLFTLNYICFKSSRDQAATEKRASEGVSNPLKIILNFVAMRMFTHVVAFEHLCLWIFHDKHITVVALGFSMYGYWLATHLMAIDILPPSSSKAGNWFKNLFRKQSLST